MLNRRHLRIKILQALYAYNQSESTDLDAAEKQLMFSLEKMYEMYLYLLLLIVEMQNQAIERIETGKNKRLPSEEDLRPNTKFVTNSPLRILDHSKNLKAALEAYKISWADSEDILKKEFRMLTETEDYKEYMSSTERGFAHDLEFLVRMFKRHMINFEMLHDYFEEKSIFWNDDLDLVASMVIKTLKSIEEGHDDIILLPLWKDPEDEKLFIEKLFRETIMQSKALDEVIAEYTKNWEIERIAVMDILLMKMGIIEAKNFESIPLKVTLNEYIELSKYYSTPKSNSFINGVLDQLFTKLKEDGSIVKIGRGLV